MMNPSVLVRKKFLVLPVILLLMSCFDDSAAAGDAVGGVDEWQYELAIYAWLPDISSDLKYSIPPGEGGGSATLDTSDILNALNFVFMGAFQAKYNKLSFAADLIYMNLSESDITTVNLGPDPGIPVSVSAKLGLKTWLVTGVAGYEIVQTDRSQISLIGGLRYLSLDSDLGLSAAGPVTTPPPAYLSGSSDFWDGIVGVKGAYRLGQNWFVPYYGDIGAGDSQFTWQLYAGIGYMFHWGDIVLGYRYLDYEMDDDKLVENITINGPLLGVKFRF